jgi:hypothetical protein
LQTHDPAYCSALHSPKSVLLSKAVDCKTKPDDCRVSESHGIVPSNPEKYSIYESMIEFMLKFDALSIPIKMHILEEFQKALNVDALRQILLHHVINHDTWHLKQSEQWPSDLNYNISYSNKKDKIEGISLPMSVINSNPILLHTFRKPGKQSGSRFLEGEKPSPLTPIPSILQCNICGCYEEANVAIAEYDLDDAATSFPTDFCVEHSAYVVTADEDENPPETPPLLGILTPMRRVFTSGYAHAIEALTPAMEETQDKNKEDQSENTDPLVTTLPDPIADDLPPLIPIDSNKFHNSFDPDHVQFKNVPAALMYCNPIPPDKK